MSKPSIILFDGVCNFCNNSVNFIIDRDPAGKFAFTSLQSEKGQEILKGRGLDTQSLDSIVLVQEGKVYQRSTAALKIAKDLSGIWQLCYGFILIPTFIRDSVYNLIAKNRYKWFGKEEACRIPTPEVRQRFL